MNVPKSVQKQIDHAEQVRSENYESEPAPIPVEKPIEEPAQPASNPSPEAEPPKQEDKSRDAAYWQHRFEVLQGKYNAEVKEIPALRSQVADLKKQLEATTEAAKPSAKESDIRNALLDGLPNEVIEDFGEDLINVVTKIAANAAKNAGGPAPQLPDELAELRAEVVSLKQEGAQDKEARFWADLSMAVPNWKEIQSTPQAQAWLVEHDPSTGALRNDILNKAAQQFHAQTVIKMFHDMKAVSERRPPENQIQATTSKATTAVPSSGKTYSRAEIKQFYHDRINGRYSAEQSAAIEQDIFAAQTDGRIIG